MSDLLIRELAKALKHDDDAAFCDLIVVAGKARRDLDEATRILRMASLNPEDAQPVAQDFISRHLRS